MKSEKNKIAAVILAAGDSKRMGKPKALLELEGMTFLDTIINNLLLSNFSPLILVLGNNYELIRRNFSDNKRIILLHNLNPDRGQLSSLQLAIEVLPPDSPGLLQVLVDHPLVNLSTYELLQRKAQKYHDEIIIPVFENQKGHPVYFGRKFFSDLLAAPLTEGARYVVNNNPAKVRRIAVADDGILKDIDTPEDFQTYV